MILKIDKSTNCTTITTTQPISLTYDEMIKENLAHDGEFEKNEQLREFSKQLGADEYFYNLVEHSSKEDQALFDLFEEKDSDFNRKMELLNLIYGAFNYDKNLLWKFLVFEGDKIKQLSDSYNGELQTTFNKLMETYPDTSAPIIVNLEKNVPESAPKVDETVCPEWLQAQLISEETVKYLEETLKMIFSPKKKPDKND